MGTFRILSLDGGGTWAMIQVMALQAIYGDPLLTGRAILRKFDLVTANSGGSVVAAALAADFTLQKILGLFLDKASREEIFVKVPFYSWLNPVRDIVKGPRYSTDKKLKGLINFLEPAFANTNLSSLPVMIGPNYRGRNVEFLIPAFDYDRKRGTFFRSRQDSPASNFPHSSQVSIGQAVHASSTAPVRYFDTPASILGRRFWDGGVAGFNNPVFVGVIEALSDNVPASDILAFSIGTGSVYRPFNGLAVDDILRQPCEDESVAGDVGVLGLSITDDPPDAATFEAHVVLGQKLPVRTGDWIADGCVIRLNPLVQPKMNQAGQWDLPKGFSRDEFSRLVSLELDALEKEDIDLIHKFSGAWIVGDIANQPIRTNQQLDCEIGHSDFRDGAALMRMRT